MYFIVDAETDGLYGKFLSVAAQVYDTEWNLTEEFYGAVCLEQDEIQTNWVREHVYPYLYQGSEAFDSEKTMLEAFWEFWIKYGQREDIRCIADVPYPVESRLFLTCVEKEKEERTFLGPYPLYDLESILRANGFGTLTERKELLSCEERETFIQHRALDDVRMTALLLKKYWK